MAGAAAHELHQAAWKAHRAGEHDSSISLLNDAIATARTPAERSVYLATKGGFLVRNGVYAAAVLTCQEALTLERGNYHALTQMGLAQHELGEYAAAADSLQRAADIRPDHNVFTVLARAQLPFDPGAAMQSALRALEFEPSWSEALTVLEAARTAIRTEGPSS